MRIGLITSAYPPNLSGISITTKNLERKLTEKGVRVYLTTPKIETAKYEVNVLPVKSWQVPKFISDDVKYSWFLKKSVYNFFKFNQVDLIHTHETFMGSYEGAKIAKELGIPCIHTYHTYWEKYLDSHGLLILPGSRHLVKAATAYILNKNHRVIALSDKMHSYLKSLNLKTTLTKLENVQDLQHLRPQQKSKALQKKLDIKDKDFVILSFSRISKEKGFDLALDKLHSTLLDNSNLKYLIAGSGPYLDTLKKKVQKLKLEKKIIFYGKYEQANLAELCSLANVYLNTAKAENQPTVLLEALACGLPAICIKDQAFDYILKNGYNGYQVEEDGIKEKILKIYSAKDLQKQLSENAYFSAHELGKKDIAGEYIKIYTEVLNEYKTGSKFILTNEEQGASGSRSIVKLEN
jgi:1,2-diacylglycerol 3-alpha-glucosyltransferase